MKLENQVRLRSHMNERASSNLSRLQQGDATSPTNTGGESTGSILDGQDITFDPTLDEDTTDTNSAAAVAQTNEATEEAASDDLDDRLMHMINIENDPPVTTTTAVAPAAAAPTTQYVTQTYYVSEPLNDYNYHIRNFHSDVKRAVYPDPQTDSMVNWGVLFIFTLLVPMLLLKLGVMYGKRLTATTFPDYKLKAVNSLLRDLAVFVFVLSIALIFHYQSVLDFYHTNIERLLLGIYIFYMMWVGISVVMLYV